MPGNSDDIKLTEDKLEEAYDSAFEIVDNAKKIGKPGRLLKQAKSALEGVNEKNKKLKDKELIDLLHDIQNRLKILIAASKKK